VEAKYDATILDNRVSDGGEISPFYIPIHIYIYIYIHSIGFSVIDSPAHAMSDDDCVGNVQVRHEIKDVLSQLFDAVLDAGIRASARTVSIESHASVPMLL
jgi:hypothetical protein